MAQQGITNLDDQLLKGLSAACEQDLTTFRIKDFAKTAQFQALWRKRKRLLKELSKLVLQAQKEVDCASHEILVDVDRTKIIQGIRGLEDSIEEVSQLWRASRDVAEIARTQSFPATLSLSLDDFLRSHNEEKRNQYERNMIITACLMACQIYPTRDTFGDIVERIGMQLSRNTRKEGRVVRRNRARNATMRVGRSSATALAAAGQLLEASKVQGQ